MINETQYPVISIGAPARGDGGGGGGPPLPRCAKALAEAHNSKTAKAQSFTIVIYLTLESAVAHNLSRYRLLGLAGEICGRGQTGVLHHRGVGRVFEVLRMGDGARLRGIEEVRAGITATQ